MLNGDNNLCFIISPIGEPDSPTRKRANQILKHIFKPAAEECGYKAIRADEISEPGDISTQVINHILEDPIVIADLTERNPNVFYELAIRHVIRKPFIQIIEEGESIPFDVFGLRTIKVDHHDMDSVNDAKKDIIAQINSIKQEGYEVTSPVSSALDLSSLRRSDNPDRRELAELIVAISSLKADMKQDLISVVSELRSEMRNYRIYYVKDDDVRQTFFGRSKFDKNNPSYFSYISSGASFPDIDEAIRHASMHKETLVQEKEKSMPKKPPEIILG